MIQKINQISFKGSEQKSFLKPNVQATSDPIQANKTVSTLPKNGSHLVVNPLPRSEFLTEEDLLKYKVFQKQWAESFAKKIGIPVENVMSRLPEISLSNAKEDLELHRIASFNQYENSISLTPIREVLNLNGGDKVKIVHESVHGFYHNLRRAYVKSLPAGEFKVEPARLVLDKIYRGESGNIVKRFQRIDIDGQVAFKPEIMNVPALSQKERAATVKTINSLGDNHFVAIDEFTVKLSKAGEKFVKENLVPQITDYPKGILGNQEQKKDKVLKRMVDYINSSITRARLLSNNLASVFESDLKDNFQVPLTDIETNIAKNSIEGLLSTIEGNILVQDDPQGVLDVSLKKYFMSYEERIAREEENLLRLDIINKKIKDIESKGFTPAKRFFKEKQIILNNLKLLELADKLNEVENQIVSAPKDSDKRLQINKLKDKAISLVNKPEYKNINDYFESSPMQPIQAETYDEMEKTLEEQLPDNLRIYAGDYVKIDKQIAEILQKINDMDTPDKLLAEIPPNTVLKTKFDSLLKSIRNIVAECDLIGVPKQFYNSDVEFFKQNRYFSEVMLKWIKKLA